MTNQSALDFLNRTLTLKVWGKGILQKREKATAEEVLEVLALGISLRKELCDEDSHKLAGSYFQAVSELSDNFGTILVLSAEQARELSPEGIPWILHETELYTRGIEPWSRTLGVTPVSLWYSFENPGEPPISLLLPNGGWNSNASLEELAKAGLTSRGTP